MRQSNCKATEGLPLGARGPRETCMHTALLTDRAIIAVGGAGAPAFLQGLVTADMAECRPQHALYAALLTPQGKILFDFFVLAEGERFLLDCAAARSEELAKRLVFYRLRAPVEIRLEAEMGVAALWGTREAPRISNLVPDPRLPELGWRAIGRRSELWATASLADYHTHRLALGVPDSADLPPDTIFALDAGLEELGAVSFSKGCYIGQEVTARMKHRASARRRLLIADSDGAIPSPGTALEAQGVTLGHLATGQGTRALALVRLDRLAVAENSHSAINAGDRIVTLRKPDWLRM